MSRIADHLYIFSTIVFTVYSQMIMRWKVREAGEMPIELAEKIGFIGKLFLNPWIVSAIIATFLAGVSWMLVVSKFDLSYAYPWTSLNFVLVLALGFFVFSEPFTTTKFIGTLLVIIGIVVISKG